MASDLKKFSECPVCFERLIPPVTTCCNGHVVCQNCRKKMAKCPTCRSIFSDNKNTFLNQMLESIPVPCKYKESGCRRETLVKKIIRHEKNCYYREERCYSCKKTILYCELNSHLKTHMVENNGVCHALSEVLTIKINMRRFLISCALTYVDEVKIHFVQRFIKDWEKKTLIYSLQFTGKKKEASKYYYEIKIDQRFPTEGKRFFTCTGVCIPYYYAESNWKLNKRAITLDLNQIFPCQNCPEEFKFRLKVDKIKD